MVAAGPWDVVIDMICFRPDEAASALRAFTGRCAHFIFCSTVTPTANTQTIVPTLETTLQVPHSDYGRGKLACEQLFLRAHAGGKIPVTIIRPSHTYGPGGGIINNLNTDATFLSRLRAGRPVIVSGDGHGLWQSAYADDVGRGFAYAAAKPACFGQSYNACWPTKLSPGINTSNAPRRRSELRPPRLVHLPTDFLLAVDLFALRRAGGNSFRFHGVYANGKLKRDVAGIPPDHTFAEGVRRTVAWIDRHPSTLALGANTLEDRFRLRHGIASAVPSPSRPWRPEPDGAGFSLLADFLFLPYSVPVNVSRMKISLRYRTGSSLVRRSARLRFALADFVPEPGFIALFNGRDFTWLAAQGRPGPRRPDRCR